MKICRLLVVVFALLPLVAGASPNQVSGYVFQDLNKNGSNNSEPPLAGAAITLDGTGSTSYHAEQTTGSPGTFSFTGLPDGDFQVCAVPPPATPPWVATTPGCVSLSFSGGKIPGLQLAEFGFKQEEENGGCTRTQGYWGNAPAGEALLATLVGALPNGVLLLGQVGYTATQLQAILDVSVSTPGPGANALIQLAHQLIAAKANLLNGASVPSAVQAAIAAADLLIGTSSMKPVGSSPQVSPSSTLGQQMVVQKDILDAYNNGNAPGGPSHCSRF